MQPLILYFYPMDFTPGCTTEACEFRDTFELFRNMDIEVIGISRDNIQTHVEFKNRHKLPFELLSDRDGRVGMLYDATWLFNKFTKRITYLLDQERNVVASYQNLFGAKKHIEEMIRHVKTSKIISG